MVYLISYDLYAPTSNREAVENSIKSLGEHIKPLTTTYMVDSSKPLSYVSEKAMNHLDKNDKMMVCEFKGQSICCVAPDDLNWLREHTKSNI